MVFCSDLQSHLLGCIQHNPWCCIYCDKFLLFHLCCNCPDQHLCPKACRYWIHHLIVVRYMYWNIDCETLMWSDIRRTAGQPCSCMHKMQISFFSARTQGFKNFRPSWRSLTRFFGDTKGSARLMGQHKKVARRIDKFQIWICFADVNARFLNPHMFVGLTWECAIFLHTPATVSVLCASLWGLWNPSCWQLTCICFLMARLKVHCTSLVIISEAAFNNTSCMVYV